MVEVKIDMVQEEFAFKVRERKKRWEWLRVSKQGVNLEKKSVPLEI